MAKQQFQHLHIPDLGLFKVKNVMGPLQNISEVLCCARTDPDLCL